MEFISNKTELFICPECKSRKIIQDNELVCSECGIVIDEIFVDSSYIISAKNTSQLRNSQYVQPGNQIEKSNCLGSFIGYRNPTIMLDSKNIPVPPKNQELYKRLKNKYDVRFRIKNYETESRILKILQDISQILKLNQNVTKNAAYFYKKIRKNEAAIKNHVSLIAFCIFYSIRIENRNAPITLIEIARVFQSLGHHVTPQLILKNGSFYKKHIKYAAIPKKSEDYLERLISSIITHPDLFLRIKKKTKLKSLEHYKSLLQSITLELLTKLSEKVRGGRNPFILMGALIYCADKLLAKRISAKAVLTQKIASEATGIAEYSIRDHYVTLLKSLFIVDYLS